jgi:apolipoprotein D and lipocalin family protein
VKVQNGGRVGENQSISATGTATPVSRAYGRGGAFIVEFPGSGTPNRPNYIVQEFGGEYSVVQTADWGVLYVLSREQKPSEKKVDVSLIPALEGNGMGEG